MLDFETQKRFLEPILKNSKNYLCADCDSIAPTWASLDFGVFLCANCSGAHRALGPTITRVRSANLDKWQEEWLSNMKIGNSQLNRFWESSPQAANRKPIASSDLNEIKRYVYQKYVKRKFVSNTNATDPLTLYKNGEYSISNSQQKYTSQSKPIEKPKPGLPNITHSQSEKVEIKKNKNTFDLLDFDFPQSTPQPKETPKQIKEQDEFTEFTHFGAVGSEQNQKSKEANLINFDTLISNQKATQPPQPQFNNHCSYQSLKAQNLQLHHPYNPQLAQHNLVYQNQYQQYYNPQGFGYNYNVQNSYGVQGHTAVNQSNSLWF